LWFGGYTNDFATQQLASIRWTHEEGAPIHVLDNRAGQNRGALGSGQRVPVEILVVDDSKVMREMIVACLRGEAGLRFTHAASGLEAIERLSLTPFDLVFLDLNMPDIGGFEVLEFVRAQDVMRRVPIIVVTTRGDESSRERALASGATRFMTKPFEPAEILGELRSLLPARPSAS
jgi:two-component system, chemotaxis family, chemotaxis protein CheY